MKLQRFVAQNSCGSQTTIPTLREYTLPSPQIRQMMKALGKDGSMPGNKVIFEINPRHHLVKLHQTDEARKVSPRAFWPKSPLAGVYNYHNLSIHASPHSHCLPTPTQPRGRALIGGKHIRGG